jgi:hypothetical protein
MTAIRFTLVALVAAGVLLAASARADAALIAGDQFLSGSNPAAGEYVHNKPFDTSPAGSDPQNPTVFGFSGPWNSGGTGLWRPVSAGLDHPAIAGEAGGAALFQWNSEVGKRQVKRDLTSPPAITKGATFWMSGMVHLNQNDADFDGYAYAGFGSDLNDDANTQGLRIGVEGDGSESEMDLVFRHRGGLGSARPESLVLLDGVQPGQTHHVLIKATVDSDLGGSSVPGNDNISIWLDPELFTDETSLGVPLLEVEDYALFNNSGLQSLTLEGADITGTGVRFDEFRLGTELADVAQAVPEPSGLMLAALGLLCAAVVWRFRRRDLGMPRGLCPLPVAVARSKVPPTVHSTPHSTP